MIYEIIARREIQIVADRSATKIKILGSHFDFLCCLTGSDLKNIGFYGLLKEWLTTYQVARRDQQHYDFDLPF